MSAQLRYNALRVRHRGMGCAKAKFRIKQRLRGLGALISEHVDNINRLWEVPTPKVVAGAGFVMVYPPVRRRQPDTRVGAWVRHKLVCWRPAGWACSHKYILYRKKVV